MRQAGTLPNEQDARRFADYLLTRGIEAQIEEEDGGWTIWIRDEDHLAEAREELEDFRRRPDDPRYRDVRRTAREIRRDVTAQTEKARKNLIEVRDRWGRQGVRRSPVVLTLIVTSVVVFFGTGFGKEIEPVMGHLTTCRITTAPDGTLEWDEEDGFAQIKQGQVWRLVTPALIHHGPAHLLFNMYWLYILGGQVETRRGSLRFAVLVLVLAATSAGGSQMISFRPLLGGMSGVGYGLFGYVWLRSRIDPGSGFYLSRDIVILFIVWFFACALGVVDYLFHIHVDNWGHGIGWAVGMAIGYAPALFRSSKGR